jgi:hypothetical protein
MGKGKRIWKNRRKGSHMVWGPFLVSAETTADEFLADLAADLSTGNGRPVAAVLQDLRASIASGALVLTRGPHSFMLSEDLDAEHLVLVRSPIRANVSIGNFGSRTTPEVAMAA